MTRRAPGQAGTPVVCIFSGRLFLHLAVPTRAREQDLGARRPQSNPARVASPGPRHRLGTSVAAHLPSRWPELFGQPNRRS